MSFQQGLSGLNATAKNLEIIGNNIANTNTYGAKASRAEFADVYAAALSGGGASAVGIGTNLQAVSQQFTQGSITSTGNSMDLAINGPGFFQVSDGNNPPTYTRNGQFKVDRDGFIANNGGDKLMGYAADATARVGLEMNLDHRLAITAPTAGAAIDFQDPTTFNNATSVTIYDAKGQDIALTFYFQKAATDNWNVFVTANGTSIAGTNAAPVAAAQITYAADGSGPIVPASGEVALNIPVTTNAVGAGTLPITGLRFDFGSSTQYGAPFGVTDMTQDGSTAGTLSSIGVEPDGTVTARYSNGESRAAARIELATFRNPQGLQPLGGNTWGLAGAAGDPILGAPSEGNFGVLQSGALEASNVDLSGELVNMIVAQRVYQANAQTIKTMDQVMQTLVNLR